MSHKDMIIDSDAKFIIDPVTREIKNDSTSETVVQHDHNSERFGFVLPRYIEGHDMMNCNRVEIHYKNIDNSSDEEVSGVYEVSDMRIDEDDETRVAFSWLVSQNATQRVGALIFLVRFSCIAGDGTVEYVWNTSIFKGIFVSSGMYNSDEIVKQYADVLERWKAELVDAANMPLIVNVTTDSEGTFVTSDKTYNEIEEAYKDGKNVLAYVEYVDVVTTGEAEKDILNLIECGNSYARFSNISKRDETTSLATFLSIETQSITDTEGNVIYNNICSLEKRLMPSKHNNVELDFSFNGYINKSNGEFVERSNFSTTDFVRAEGKIILNGSLSGLKDYYYVNCYDVNKNYLGGLLLGDGTPQSYYYTDIELISGTEYVRIATHETYIDRVEMYVAPLYLIDVKTINGQSIKGSGDIDTFFKPINVDFPYSGYIPSSQSLGGELKENSTFLTTDYLEVSPTIMFTATCFNMVNNYHINCYNKHKMYLGGVVEGTGSTKTEYVNEVLNLPEGTRFIRITNNKAQASTFKVYISPIFNSDNHIDNELLDFSTFRKFGVIGDSLSVGYMSSESRRNIWYSWGQYLARSIGNTCLNFGFSGATCDSWWTGNTYGKGAFDKDENLCQAYIVGLGTNDPVKNGTLSLGAVTDIDWEDYNNNQATFYGQYARILQHIREKAPYAPVFVFTLPYPRVEDNKNMAIKEIVQNENISNAYLVDLNSPEYDYFFKDILPKYANNGHFTAIGYKHCATMINIAISNVMRQNIDKFKDIYSIPYGSNDVID